MSTRWTLVMWMTAAIIIVGLASLVANIHLQSQPFERQLNERAKSVAAELVTGLSGHVWNMDNDAIEEYFANYPQESLGLVTVEVRTEYEDLLYSKIYSENESPVAHRQAVIRDGRTIGFIEVALSSDDLGAIKRAIGRTGIEMVAAATVAILCVVILIVNFVVVRPVKRTISDLRRIATGNYNHELPGAPTSELRLINQEINIMATEISQRQTLLETAVDTREKAEQELLALNEELEDRIKRRTNQLRRLAQMLTAAQDDEQRRIAEGLHDDVAQLLAAGRMKIAIASTHAPDDSCRSMMTDVDKLVEQAYERLRLLSFELASSTLYQWGLKDSLEKLCAGMNDRFNTSFQVIEEGNCDDIDETSSTVLFKAAREILFNVIKHSGVVKASIALKAAPESFLLMVEDDGRGFDPKTDIGAGHGLGLFSIRERMEDIDGEMHIESKPGLTRISLIVPRLRDSATKEEADA